MYKLKIAASSRSVLWYAETKAMRMGGFNFFRFCLIRRSSSHTRVSGRKLRWGCCLDYLFYFSYSSQQLKALLSIGVAKAFLSATIRKVFTAY